MSVMRSHQILGAGSEAVCLRHRKLVRWMAAPGWWHHVSDHQTCMAMYRENAPLVWVHNGKPFVMQPGRETRFWVRGLFHATELSQSQPPVVKLEYLVNELKARANANPQLKVLHSEFAAVLREMREAENARTA